MKLTALLILLSAGLVLAEPPTGDFGDDFTGYAPGAAPGGFGTSATVNTGAGGIGKWTITSPGVYEGAIANAPGNGNGMISSIRGVPYLGGGVNRNFTYSSKIKILNVAQNFRLGLVALGGAQPIYIQKYYFAGIDQAGHLFIQSSASSAQGLAPGAAASVPGGVGDYTFTLEGKYNGAALTLILTVSDGTHTASTSATAAPGH